jgi:hypothetical protein
MKVTKAEYEALPKSLKDRFTQVEGNEDEYDNGEENASGLKSARDKERDAAKKLREEKAAWETEKAELEERIAEFESGADKGGADKDALKKSYEAKLQKQKEKHEAEVTKIRSALQKTHVDAVADKLAGEISTVPDLMSEAIRKRLRVNLDGDEPSTEILGPDGKPSAATLEELRQELLGNERYKGILIGSSGSGGGAGGGGGGGGAFDIKRYKNQDGTTNWSLVHTDMKKDPELFGKVQEANKSYVHDSSTAGQ